LRRYDEHLLRPMGSHRKMKILQIFNRYSYYGGEEGWVKTIANALRSHHHIQNLYGSTETMLGTTFFSKAVAPLKAIWNWDAFDKVIELQNVEKFDLWIVHNVFPGLSPAIYDAARKLDVPVLQYLHNYRFGCINGFLLNHGKPCTLCLSGSFLPAVQTRCWHESRVACATMGISMTCLRTAGVLQQVAHWVAISHAQKAIHTRIGIPAEKISVLHHFYDQPVMRADRPGRDVLFVGRLSQEKGVETLIDAWKQAGIRDRDLVIAGEGPMQPQLEERARSVPNIRFTGFLKTEELEQAWLNAAVSVVPSIWEEPFGRVVLESWGHGVPVLAARIGALPELTEKGDTGWLFDPTSSESLSQALRTVLADESALAAAAAKCHEAVSKFSKENWITAMNTILESVKAGAGGER